MYTQLLILLYIWIQEHVQVLHRLSQMHNYKLIKTESLASDSLALQELQNCGRLATAGNEPWPIQASIVTS